MNGAPPNGHDLGAAAPVKAKVEERQEPIFEIMILSRVAAAMPLHHIRIWGDGHVEGIERLADGNSVLIQNRIPLLLDEVMQPMRDYISEVDQEIGKLTTNGVAQVTEPGKAS